MILKSLKGLRVSRVSGAHNTFFIANIFDPQWVAIYGRLTETEKVQFVQELCQNNRDLQTDGLLFLRPEKGFDFAWDFYNADGSHAEMCGNAARCATLFFIEKVEGRRKVKFLTGAGEITGEILQPDLARVEMTQISELRNLRVLDQPGLFVNTGVPHFVVEMKVDRNLAQGLRKVPDFGPTGANITFVEIINESRLRAVTFERGVEDFTQACGTGAVAAAMYLQNKTGVQNSIEVHMPGGVLKIENARAGERPFLTGPVRIEFEMEIK